MYTNMSKSSDTAETKPKGRRLIKPGELILSIVFVAVCAVLIAILLNKLRLRRDVSNARTVSDKVITDIRRRDGAGIRSLGSPKFQQTYSAAELTQDFKSVEIATLKTPTLDRQIVVDGSSGRVIYFVYKYTALKVPFYVRTTIQHQSGHWYLTGVNGNIDETTLTGS
jgi:hypothetical protein